MHAPPLPILKYSSSVSKTGGNERAQLWISSRDIDWGLQTGYFFTANESCWSKKDQNWFYVRWRVQLSVSLSFLVLFFRMAGSLTLKLIGRSLPFKGLSYKRHLLRLDGLRNLDGLCRCTNIDPQSARVRAQELRPPSCEQMQSTSSLKLVFIWPPLNHLI